MWIKAKEDVKDNHYYQFALCRKDDDRKDQRSGKKGSRESFTWLHFGTNKSFIFFYYFKCKQGNVIS